MTAGTLLGNKIAVDNKRVSPRMTTMLKVEYGNTGGEVFHDYSTNISATGLFLHSGQPLQKGERIHLRLALPGARQPLLVIGEIMWAHRGGGGNPALPGVGLRFRFLSADQKQALVAFLKEFGGEE